MIYDAFGIPTDYGRNLDAMGDMIGEPLDSFLIISGVHTLPENLQSYFSRVLIVFDSTKKRQAQWNHFFDYRVAD